MGECTLDSEALKEHRSSFVTTSTCCSVVSGMESDHDIISSSRLSSLFEGSVRGDKATATLSIPEEEATAVGAAADAVELQKETQAKLFDRHSVRVLKQIPLPDWMKIFVPRVVRLQTGSMPYMEYARSESGEVRQRKMISVWTRVDRLPKNKLSVDFRMPDSDQSVATKSSLSGKSTLSGPVEDARACEKVTQDKWILKFDSKRERDSWARLIQDAVDLLAWINKFTLGGEIMATENSSLVECFTWMDRGKPSYVLKSMRADSKKKSHSARSEIHVHHLLTHFSTHPNIVNLHDAYRQREQAYLVLENCMGGDLFDFISQHGALDERQAKTLFRRIANAVNYVHDQGIVHLDIKPENLFFKVSPNQLDTIKLGDFGSAMVLADGSNKTAVSCTVGYAAPEVLEHGHVSFAADVFSAGAVLYTVLGGYSPFSAPSDEEMLEKTLRGDVVFHDLEWRRVSKEAKDLILGMMHPDPAQRLSMEEVLEHSWFKQW